MALILPKPSAIQNIFTNRLNTMGNSISWESELINTIPLNQKMTIFGRFLLLKAPLHTNKITHPSFFQDPESCVSWLRPHTGHWTNTFSN